MHSDPGADTPHTGDDDVWRDLVARLEQDEDAFMDESFTDGATSGSGGIDGGGTGGAAKSVADFDPLGVWAQQSEPAPEEPAAGEHRRDGFDSAAAAAFGPRDYAAEDDDEEGTYVPEDLPSLRDAEPVFMLSWIAAAGGPLFLVFCSIFWRQIPLMLVVAVVVGFLAGTGYLLYRLPKNRDHDSGDGAVV
ncbi:hypothetical protein [Arthrobacter sp. H35-D1]|uniref:hypothetical protein n=1 Tax=Arthrobacter sp. H35-D1 TaxID=3046202 RepID=UPI0024BB949A|nr:hypothetical protein [Arthrobacter sp. H35-D1]MDJ0313267.1 hypothetical protein [Arthrobacter sp. H35-D1]